MSSYKKMERASLKFSRKNPLHCDPSPPPRLFSFPFFRSNLRTHLFPHAYNQLQNRTRISLKAYTLHMHVHVHKHINPSLPPDKSPPDTAMTKTSSSPNQAAGEVHADESSKKTNKEKGKGKERLLRLGGAVVQRKTLKKKEKACMCVLSI